MTCLQYQDWIQDQADGTLAPIRASELERHLEDCADCRAFAEDVLTIQQTAAALDPLEPPGRVWLQIAGRLRQEGRVALPVERPAAPRRHAVLLAIAATLVIGVSASLVLLLPQFRPSAPAAPSTASAPGPSGNVSMDDTVQSVEAEFRLAEQHYQNAIAKLEQAARLDQTDAVNGTTMDPQMAAMLQKNLRVIDDAITESRAALRSEPLSVPARDSLFDALKRKVILLQDTIALMNEMRKGNSAGAAQLVDGLNKS